MSIFYRVIEDDFSADADQGWKIDCLIQTEDSADFEDFGDALDECLERIQERIDRQEDVEGDNGYLDKLREKLGDTSEAIGEDWDCYDCCISQPIVLRPGEKPGFVCLTTVEGRHEARRLLDGGHEFNVHDRDAIEHYERLAAVGEGGPTVKEKTLKVRARPPITFAKVKVSPALLESLPIPLLRGLLAQHRRLWEEETEPYRPLLGAFTSRLGGANLNSEYIIVTMFDGDKNICTFATVVPSRFPSPDHDRVMDEATEWFAGTDAVGGVVTWNPSIN